MENRLRKLRDTMEKSTFSELKFSDKIRRKVHNEIRQQDEKAGEITLAILQLMQNEKTGFELTSLLRARGIRKFEEHEGLLYTILHKLEHNRLLTSFWDGEAKLYRTTDKGRKLLRRAEKDASAHGFLLKGILEE